MLSCLINAKLEIKTMLEVACLFRELNQKAVIISTIALHLSFVCVQPNWQCNLYFLCKAYICDRCVVIWKIYNIMDTYIAIGTDNMAAGEIWLMGSYFSELPQLWSNKSLINLLQILQTSFSYKVSENELRFHGLFFGGLGFFLFASFY